MELIPPLTPDEEAKLQNEVDAALEQTRTDRDAKIQKEIDECDSCRDEGLV